MSKTSKWILGGIGFLLALFVIAFVVVVINNVRSGPTTANLLNRDILLSDSLGVSYQMSGSGAAKSAPRETAMDYGENHNNTGGDDGSITEKKIIKNAYLDMYVSSIDDTVKLIQESAVKMGGFVVDSSISQNQNGEKRGRIQIRIPADKFEGAVNNLKQLAVEVESENVTADDVTEEFVDLEAQLRNLRAEESQYLEIMERAYTIEDTLNVAARLSDVRGRIERIEGRLKYLSRLTDMSTITVNLSSDEEIEVFGIRWRPLVVVKKALKNMVSGLASYVDSMVAFIFFLPVLLVWAITIGVTLLIVWKLFRWISKGFIHKQ